MSTPTTKGNCMFIVDYFRSLFCKHDWEVYGENMSNRIMDKLGAKGEPQERVQMCRKCQDVRTVIIKGN